MVYGQKETLHKQLLTINQNSCTNRVTGHKISSHYTQLGFSTLDFAFCQQEHWANTIFFQPFLLKLQDTNFYQRAFAGLERWCTLVFVKCCEDAECFRSAACSEWGSEQVGMHTQRLGEEGRSVWLHRRQGWDVVNWGNSPRAEWWGIWESRAAVSPHSRSECICYRDEANTLSFVLTLVRCSAHPPPPLLLEHLLRSHFLLCSPSSAFWGWTLVVAHPIQCPASLPALGHRALLEQSGTHTGDKGTVNPSTQRELKKHPHCACWEISAVPRQQGQLRTPQSFPGAGEGGTGCLLRVCSHLMPLDPPQDLHRYWIKILDQELHTVAGLHPILSSKFRMKGQKLIESQKILHVQWNNCQCFFSATSSGLLDIGPSAFPCFFISDALCEPFQFHPVPVLAPMQQVVSVGVGTSASVQWQEWSFCPAHHYLPCTCHGLPVSLADRDGELACWWILPWQQREQEESLQQKNLTRQTLN